MILPADGAVLVGADTWLGTAVATDLAQFAMQLVGEVSSGRRRGRGGTRPRSGRRSRRRRGRAGRNRERPHRRTGTDPASARSRQQAECLTVHAPTVPTHALQIATLGAHAFAVMVDNDRLRAADLRRRAEVAFITGASDLLAQSLEIDLTMALVPRLFVPRLGEWCAVLRCFDDGPPVVVSATHARETQTVAVRHALDLAAEQARAGRRAQSGPAQHAVDGARRRGGAADRARTATRRAGGRSSAWPPARQPTSWR